jgi:hypothetical protein
MFEERCVCVVVGGINNCRHERRIIRAIASSNSDNDFWVPDCLMARSMNLNSNYSGTNFWDGRT